MNHCSLFQYRSCKSLLLTLNLWRDIIEKDGTGKKTDEIHDEQP